jgi:hypothetical protein
MGADAVHKVVAMYSSTCISAQGGSHVQQHMHQSMHCGLLFIDDAGEAVTDTYVSWIPASASMPIEWFV